ncbi:MAG: hypothetical protein O3B01_16995 [Planctomycetota bacterium]|nr:hypothetical protein [Planctomycetota bacterium]MDA1140274.1 hypothetical protein [Planctomycetota bacterium]
MSLRAGFSRRDITPVESVPLNESHWCGLSKGVLSPLFVRSVAFHGTDGAAILISCDVIAFEAGFVSEIRAAIARRTSVSERSILIAATQNHSSPKIIPAEEGDQTGFDSPALADWHCTLKKEIIEAGTEAFSRLAPVHIGFATGHAPGVAGNRRPLRSNGTAVMTWHRPDPNEIADPGVEDDTIRVVILKDATSQEIHGVLMNFACHPNVLWTTERISSDFPGRACRILEEALPSSVPVYFTGFCGNIDPFKYMRVPKNAYTAPEAFEPGAPVDLCIDESDRFGDLIGDEVLNVTQRMTASQTIASVRSSIVRITGDLRDGVHFPDEVEIQAIAVDERLAFVGVPGEPFLEIEHDIRTRSPFEFTFVCGQANGFSGYMPTRIAYSQGGYETGNSWTKFGPGIGESVADAAVEALGKLNG